MNVIEASLHDNKQIPLPPSLCQYPTTCENPTKSTPNSTNAIQGSQHWLYFRPSRGQPSSPDVAFIRPPEVEGGERATASLAYGWESEIGAVSEVLAEPALCKTPGRSTRIRGVVTRAEGACGELPCLECICMGREELVLGSSPLFG